jgi:UPF0716 family protein affecting phage T7 exclusion
MKRLMFGFGALVLLQALGELALFEWLFDVLEANVTLASQLWYAWTTLQVILAAAWGVFAVRTVLAGLARNRNEKTSDCASPPNRMWHAPAPAV